MQIEWKGNYLDGQSAARHDATIRLMPSGLEITTDRGTFWWPYPEIAQTQGFYAGEEVRLERGGAFPEVLLVPDPAFLGQLHRVAPGLATRFHNPARRHMRARMTVLAAFAVVGITTGLYLWGIPAVASVVSSVVPVSWEERLGEAVAQHLAPPAKKCTDPTLARAVDEIMASLTRTLPDSPYTFRVAVVDNPTINAFAAPGGYIVIFRGLLERTRTAEELAGVLSHEMQHILKRHATRMLVQNASTAFLLAAITGETGDAMAFGLEGARLLGALRYSRHHEEEADAEGVGMLVLAGIDPEGLIAFFETLREDRRQVAGVLSYLSTHPSIGDRIERLKALAAGPHAAPVKLLPEYEWQETTALCTSADQ
jgi:beta-barrel assembly-enhancing protease